MASYNTTTPNYRINLYSSASTSSALLASILENTSLVVSDYSQNTDWFCTTYNGTSGFIQKDTSMVLTDVDSDVYIVNSNADELNMRYYPDLSAPLCTRIPKGTTVTVQRHNDNWSSLNYRSYVGFVMTSFLKEPDPPITETSCLLYAKSKSPALNLRTGPGTEYGTIYQLPRDRIVLCEAKTSNGWYKTRHRGAPAYLSESFLEELVDTAVHPTYVERCNFIAINELGNSNSANYEGASGAWCQYFVNWLLRASLMPHLRVPTSGGTGNGIAFWVKNENYNGGHFYFKSAEHKKRINNETEHGYNLNVGDTLTPEEEAFAPQAGDIIYLRWDTEPQTVNVSHTGFVTSVRGTNVSTIEGNAGQDHKVEARTYSITDPRIVGYARPNYVMQPYIE